MASRIAALQAKLGGGAMIMGGMRPGAARPIRKKKTRQRRASLDNSALLDRTVIKGSRKKKKVTGNLNFDELEDTDEKNPDQFAQSVSSNINMKKTKPISASNKDKDDKKSNNNNTSTTTKKKRFGMGGMGGMGGLLAKAGGFKNRKSKKGSNKNEDNNKNKNQNKNQLSIARDKGQSRSFSKGVTTVPLIAIQTTDNNNNNNNNNDNDKKVNNKRNIGMSKTPTPMMVNSNMFNKYNAKNTSKTPTINASGYSLAKSAGNEDKLIEIISKKHGKRHVRLFVDLHEYIDSKKGESGKGLVIDSFCENKYGAAMQNLGVGVGWKLSKIAKQDANKMSFFIIKNQLKNQAQMTKKKGYDVTFEGEYEKKQQAPASAPLGPTKIKQPMKEPTEQKVAPVIETKLKCELVKEEMGLKVVRLFATFDKYFEGIKGDDGKGLIINGFICDSFKDLGIEIGWKLSKLGKRNVIKSSFVMLRNQLMAQASTAKKFGYELTFIDTTTKQNSTSTPNSPNIKTYKTNKNVPQTVPLNPVTAPKEKQIKNKTEEKEKEKEKGKKVPQLKTAENPFDGMKQLNIADTQKKENESGKRKMEHVRKNSLPTSPDKPKFRPKINKADIKKKKPPTTQSKNVQKKDDEKSKEKVKKKKDNVSVSKQPKKEQTSPAPKPPKEKTETKEKEKEKTVIQNKKKEKVKVKAVKAPTQSKTQTKKKEKTPPAQPKPKPKPKPQQPKPQQPKPQSQPKPQQPKPQSQPKPQPTQTKIKAKKEKTAPTSQPPKTQTEIEPKTKEKKKIVAKQAGAFKITPKKKTKPLPTTPKQSQTQIKPKKEKTQPKKVKTQPKKEKTPPAPQPAKEESKTEQKTKEKEKIGTAPKQVGSFNITPKNKIVEEKKTDIKPKQTTTPLTSAKQILKVDDKQSKKNKKSSYSAPKSCELIDEINASTKKIKLYQDFEKFFSAQGANGNKGFAVKKMDANEFGNTLSELGICEGWIITECASKKLGNRMFAMLKNQISAAARKNRSNGYEVIFENPNAQNVDEQKIDPDTTKAKVKPKVGKKTSVEAVKQKPKITKKVSADTSKSIPKITKKKSVDRVTKSKVTTPKTLKTKISTPKTSKPKVTTPKTSKTSIPKATTPKTSIPKNSVKPKPKVTKKTGVDSGKPKVKATTPKPKAKTKKITTPTPKAKAKAKSEEKKTDPIKLATATTPTIKPLDAAAKISTTDKTNSYKINEPIKTKPKEDEIEEKKFKKQRKSSYETPKSCELIQDMDNKKKIKMYQEFNKFFSAQACEGNKGFAVKKMTNNEFGDALSALGIGEGWRIIECANRQLGNKMFAMIKNQITAAAKKDPKTGYVVIFEKAKDKPKTAFDFDDKKVDSSNKKSQNVKKTSAAAKARSPRGSKQRVEVIDDGDGVKRLRLYHNMDKYIRSSAEKGPRGFVIAAFVKMFGDDLKECGVDIGWKLVKLGSKDVSRAFYQMTKTNLGVEFRNHKSTGYEVTFAAPQ